MSRAGSRVADGTSGVEDKARRAGVTGRIAGVLPVRDAANVAADVEAGATVAVSRLRSVGYSKAVPLALAQSNHDLALAVVSGGSTGSASSRSTARSRSTSTATPTPPRAGAGDSSLGWQRRDRRAGRLQEAALGGIRDRQA